MIGVADTVLLVLMPGSGDSIQALKAGIMEIPDVIAINKMDHPAAKTMLSEVRSVLALDRDRAWKVPIVLTEAQRGENVPKLWETIEEHRAFLEREGRLEERRRRNLAGEVFAVASARATAITSSAAVERDPELAKLIDEVAGARDRPADGGGARSSRGYSGSMPTLADIERARERSSTASRASRRSTARRRSRGWSAARCN